MAIRRKEHVDRVNSYILVWCGDEMEQVSFDGEVINLPPSDVQAKPGPGSPYRMEGARDRADLIVPGTVRVSDRHAIIEGNRIKVFDADQFVRWIETIRRELLDRGLFIVDLPEEVEEAKTEGRPLYEKSQDARARQVLETELFRRKKWEEKGTPPPPSSSEHIVQWAIKHLNERGSALSLIPTEEIVGALSIGAPKLTDIPAKLVPKEPPSIEKPLASQRLYEQAIGLGVKLKVVDLNGLLTGDENVMKDVAERIRVREAELAPAPAAPAAPGG